MAVAAVVAAATIRAACSRSKSSSSSSGSSGQSTATTGATASALGTPNAATGTPVKIGYLTDGKTANIDNSSEVPAAQAAAKYINDYLGGVAGHPISLDVCDDQQTPSGATDCANQFITDKVPVVLYNVSGQGGSVFTPLAAAKVPLMALASIDQSTLQAKSGAYVIQNGLVSAFAGPAKIAQLAGAKRAAEVVTDVPAASGPAKALDPIFYKNAGVAIDVVAVPVGTADLTPQMQAELAKNPDQFHVLGDVSLCTAALKALKGVGFTKTIVVIQQCISGTSASGIPGGYAGMKLVTNFTTDPADPDVKIYLAAMAKYSPGTPPFVNGVTQGGFGAVLGFQRAMTGATGDITTTSVESTVTAMSPQPMPFGGGITFQCNGQQVAITPPVCSTGALEATLNASGQPTGSYTPLDAAALLKLG
ncbi:MAG: ABC transporter substrate-binding protein [Acidimicrobiales bacterium]